MNHKIYQGDVLSALKKFPDECVDMIMTSPPYWGLRDYKTKPVIWGGRKNCDHQWANDKPSAFCSRCNAWRGQLGLEPTFDLFIQHLLQIMIELKRVLKKTGSFYLNMGDSYGGSWQNYGTRKSEQRPKHTESWDRKDNPHKISPPSALATSKCLLGIPWRLALKMIDEQGWILRNRIIWHKPNPMPSSVKDRLTNTCELVFHFVKNKKYYYDLDTIREPIEQSTIERYGRNFGSPTNKYNDQDPSVIGGAKIDLRPKELKGKRGLKTKSFNTDSPQLHGYDIVENIRGKNPGDFWEITTQAFKDAHFAVFPEKLCEKPIESSCPKEICKKCGKARERISKNHYHNDTTISGRPAKGNDTKGRRKENAMNFSSGERTRLIVETSGWTDCGCKAGFEPGIVLDPFAGSGTLALMAEKLGRNSLSIEIKPDYVKMIEKRLKPYISQDKLFEKKSTLEVITV